MATLSLRLQVRHWRLLVWAGTVALSGVAAFSLWQIYTRFRAKAYEPRSSVHFDQLIVDAAGSIDQREVKVADWKDYQPLVSCPINGYEPAPPPKTEPTDVVAGPPPKKPLADVLTVTAITSATDDTGRIVVKYKDDAVKAFKDEVVLKVGAMLAPPYEREPFDGRLKAIRVDSAVFDWCGEEVEVHPMRKEEGVTAAATPAGAATHAKVDTTLTEVERKRLADTKGSEKSTPFPPDCYVVGNKDYNDMSARPDDYLKEARIGEVITANGKKEVVLGQLKPSGYLAKSYGVQPGDALISINGVALSTKAEAYKYVRDNGELSKYVVVLRRKGREITKTILVHRE